MSLSELKNKSSLNKITEILEKADNYGSKEDTRFWTPNVDKNGNGRATIRFLPAPQGEDEPFVKIYSHGFQGPSGLWYIENSRTTIGKEDPVSAYNSKLWATGSEKNKEIARKQKRKLSFISNIIVIDDPDNPENNGKVFLYRYGKTVFDMIKEAVGPGFDEFDPFDPFDPWNGANFRVAIRHADGYRKYDRSKFLTPGPIGSDDEIEAIWNQEHSLQEFLDIKNFKSYEELEAKLYRVLDLQTSQTSEPSNYDHENLSTEFDENSHVSNDTSDETPPWSKNDGDPDLEEIFGNL